MKVEHILLIEQDPQIRSAYCTVLSREEYTVVTAQDSASALETLEDTSFDLIFSNTTLGNVSGLSVLREIKNRKLKAPVIMITGDPSIESAAEALRLDAFDYLAHPISASTLLRVTKHALQHKFLLDEKRTLETERERDRSHLEAIFRSVTEAILTVDHDMRVMECNEKVHSTFGTNPKGENFKRYEHDPNQCLRVCCRVLHQTLQNGQAIQEYCIECTNAEGAAQVLILNCAPLKDHVGHFIGAVLVIRNVTRLSSLQKALEDRHQFHNIIGKNKRMQAVYGLLEDLKDTDTTVLITGESGTGKELVAKALHYSGRRAHQPIVTINCSVLAETLLESELFGHVKGAFTGAIRDKDGRFQMADLGTIFLDEIGDISPRIQLKLLRVLEEKEIERVGDSTPHRVNVRVIAATNRDLRNMVQTGEFREDLYYRLKVVEVLLPPLRERRDDIPLLLEHYLDLFSQRFHKQIKGIHPEAEKILLEYPWPGNIRELQHALEHAFVLCHSNTINVFDLPPELREFQGSASRGNISEPEAILDALRQTGWNKAKAARLMGISRQTMYRKLEEYDLPRTGEQL